MKRIFILSLIIFLVGCEDRLWDNPFDSKSDVKKDEWTPSNLTIEQTSLSSFQLSWKKVEENIEGYRIDRQIANGAWRENFITIQSDSLENFIISDTSVTPDTSSEYNYRLYAFAAENLSNAIEKKVKPEFPPASDIEIEQLSPTIANISWQDNSIGEDGFLVQKNQSIIDTLSENSISYIDSGIVPQKNTSLQVIAFKDQIYSASSTEYFKCSFDAPTNFEITKLDLESVKLTWKDNVTGEDGYKIDRKKGEEEWQIGYAVLDKDVEEYIDTAVETNVKFSYRVYGISSDYATDKTTEAITITFEAPENIQFTQKSLSEIKISWNAESQGEEGFRLYRKDEYDQWQLLAETQNKNYTDLAPLYGDNFYKLYAFYNDQKSDSLEENFDNNLAKPENLASEIITSSSVELNWENVCEFEHAVSLERKTNSSDFQQIALLSGDVDNYTDENIDSTVTYYYAVRAYVDPYYSEYSNVDTVLVIKPLPFETVEVIAGDFIFGASNSTQNISYNYEISKYEVTNAEYVVYLQKAYNAGELTVTEDAVSGNYSGDTQYSAGEYTFYDLGDENARIVFSNGTFSVVSDFEDHPVTQVSWFGANAFAKYYHCKLPTDFEWEKAARGNTTRTYPWGNDIENNYCNFHDSGDPYDNGTTPVGYYNGWNQNGYVTQDNVSYYGAYDMAGNVWEWTSDWYSDGSNKRATRGGSWYNSNTYVKAYMRYPQKPTAFAGYVGFRVMRKM